MKLTNLKSTIFNLNEYIAESGNYERAWNLLRKYQERLEEEVELRMFVPCTTDGKVLEKPVYNPDEDEIIFERKYDAYKKAKKRVLFKDVETKVHFPMTTHHYINDVQMITITEDTNEVKGNIWFEVDTFADVIKLCDGVELTENGIKYFEDGI